MYAQGPAVRWLRARDRRRARRPLGAPRNGSAGERRPSSPVAFGPMHVWPCLSSGGALRRRSGRPRGPGHGAVPGAQYFIRGMRSKVLDEDEGPLSWREWLAHKHQQYNITRSAASVASAPNSLCPRLVAEGRRRVRVLTSPSPLQPPLQSPCRRRVVLSARAVCFTCSTGGSGCSSTSS